MALTRLPAELRRRAACPTALASPRQRRHASVLFALSALSNSRETQHFSKASKLSRVEHSPALKLIQSSEVDPFAKKDASKREISGVSDRMEKEGAAEEVGKSGLTISEVPIGGSDAACRQNPPSSSASPPSGSSGSGGNANKPPEDGEAAMEEDPEIDNEEALDLGRTVLGRHVQDKRKLREGLHAMRTELQEARAELKEAQAEAAKLRAEAAEKKEAEEWNQRVEKEGDRVYRWRPVRWFTWIFGGITAYLFYQHDVPVQAMLERMKYLRGERDAARAQIPSAWEQEQNKRNAQKALELAAAETQMRDLRMKLASETRRLESETRKEVLAVKTTMDRQTAQLVLDKEAAHEAKIAEWARKAEELIAAVEKTDAGSLSKAERDAYLAALVFLRVKEMPERRWWKGLFWRQQ